MSDDSKNASPDTGGPHASLADNLVRALRGCALLLLDMDGQIVLANQGARDLTGYPQSELCSKPYADLFTPTDRRSKIPAHGLRRARDEGRYEADGWLNKQDGSMVWAALSVSPAYDETGTMCGYAVMIRDVSEKRAAANALFNSEQQFRVLVQGVRDYAIYMLDPEGYITNWNAGAALIKGYTAEEIIGRHFSTFYTEEDRRKGEPERGLETARRLNTFQNEAWRVRKDGTYFWASVVIDPIYDERGTLLGFAKVTRDITDKKRSLEKSVRQREAQHQSQKLEALGRLTGSVAHDFNNMLSIIRTAAEMLGSGMKLSHDTDHYVRMITDASERAARLTDQLLSFARQRPLRLEVFSPSSRIESMQQVLETTLGSRNKLVIELDDHLSSIKSDSTQFDTAVLNLVINARDAMAEGGSVLISGQNVKLALDEDAEEREWVAIEVRDEGTGIDPENLANIFEPFFTTKPMHKGTGLGLSQVYGFVKQSGGEIRVDSKVGAGTTFTLYLPPVHSAEEDPWAGLITPGAVKELPESLNSATATSRVS